MQNEKTDVLDKGFVQLMRCADSDLDVVNAARVSFDKESEWLNDRQHQMQYITDLAERKGRDWYDNHAERIYDWSRSDVYPKLNYEDHRIIAYLARENHWSPFSHPQVRFRVKAPIFVRTQLFKHKVGSAENEVSRRYVDDEPEFYEPTVWRGRPPESIKQGSQGLIPEKPFGDGHCWMCGDSIPLTGGNRERKHCSPKCQAAYYRSNDPDSRLVRIKSRCKDKGIEFDLEPGDIIWPERCPVLGIELDYMPQGTSGHAPNSPSVDRIDPNRGYVRGNVMVMSSKANVMKNNASTDELIRFARWSLLHFNGQSVPQDGTYKATCNHAVSHYKHLLSVGVCPEQARGVLPQSVYTSWIWTGSLAFFARVYNQRTHSHAQWETAEYARAIGSYMEELFPVSWKALTQKDG